MVEQSQKNILPLAGTVVLVGLLFVVGVYILYLLPKQKQEELDFERQKYENEQKQEEEEQETSDTEGIHGTDFTGVEARDGEYVGYYLNDATGRWEEATLTDKQYQEWRYYWECCDEMDKYGKCTHYIEGCK